VKPRVGWALLVFLAMATGWGVFRFQFLTTPSVPTRPHSSKSPQSIAKPHLDLAEKRIDDATRNHFDALNQLFDRSRSQSKAFAKLALGWGSKWRIVADATPFTRGDRHPQYLKEQFELHVLKGADLTKAIEQAVTEFLAEIRSLESQMLVDLRVDVEDLSHQYDIGLMDAVQLQSHFDAAIENAKQVSGIDLQSNISSQLVSIVVGEVLTQVAVRLGVSAGILGVGAASGWATLGIGVVVGLVIDQIVSAIWAQWSDPTKNLDAELTYQLKMMQHVLCYGDEHTKGLVQQFEAIAKTRAVLRRIAVLKLLGADSESALDSPNIEKTAP
jgi:hypothetical protein